MGCAVLDGVLPLQQHQQGYGGKNENLEAVKIIVPVSQRAAVIAMAHRTVPSFFITGTKGEAHALVEGAMIIPTEIRASKNLGCSSICGLASFLGNQHRFLGNQHHFLLASFFLQII